MQLPELLEAKFNILSILMSFNIVLFCANTFCRTCMHRCRVYLVFYLLHHCILMHHKIFAFVQFFEIIHIFTHHFVVTRRIAMKLFEIKTRNFVHFKYYFLLETASKPVFLPERSSNCLFVMCKNGVLINEIEN